MDAEASMRPCIYGVDRLRRALAMVSDEIKFHFDIYVHLFPVAILTPAKYKEGWGEFSAAKETEERKKQMKFMILAAAERIEKQPEGKNLDQIVKKCEHFLLDFIDPRLGMDAMDMIPLNIGTPQFATLLGTTLNLTSVTFRPSNSHWTEMVYGGGDKQGPKELVANFDKVLGEFVQLVQREWAARIGMSTIKNDGDGDGGGGKRNKTLEEAGIFGKAEEFALVRQELTKWNLKDNLGLSFDDGNLALLRVKWQVKVPFVRIKNRLKHLMNIVEWRIEGKLENWLPPHGGGTFTRLTCLGTIGNDSALFLVLSSHSQLEGVLRVDNLGSYFKKLIAERAH